MSMNVDFTTVWLRESFPWMGSHSGYEKICDGLRQQQPDRYKTVFPPSKQLRGPARRGISWLTNKVKASDTYTLDSTRIELSALWKSLWCYPSLIHILYVERRLGVLAQWRHRFPYRLVATAHQPTGLWRLGRHDPEILRQLDALIVLSSREVKYFEAYLPGRVHLILHGVDTEFFCPSPEPVENASNPRFVFSGTWLRDLDTLAEVIETTLAHDSRVQFDLIVPRNKRDKPEFYRIARHAQVHWHGGLSDSELREVYRQGTALLLPLIDCTANNALLEGMACGLPVISNDVGGISDYTRSNFADLLPPKDVESFVEAILKLAHNFEERVNRGQLARAFALEHLSWTMIARQTRAVYEKALTQ